MLDGGATGGELDRRVATDRRAAHGSCCRARSRPTAQATEGFGPSSATGSRSRPSGTGRAQLLGATLWVQRRSLSRTEPVVVGQQNRPAGGQGRLPGDGQYVTLRCRLGGSASGCCIPALWPRWFVRRCRALGGTRASAISPVRRARDAPAGAPIGASLSMALPRKRHRQPIAGSRG